MKSITLYPLRSYVKLSISYLEKYMGENTYYTLHDVKFYNLLTGKRIKLGSFNIQEDHFLEVKQNRVNDKHPNLFNSKEGPHIIYVKWHIIMSVIESLVGYNSVTNTEQDIYRKRIHSLVKTESDD